MTTKQYWQRTEDLEPSDYAFTMGPVEQWERDINRKNNIASQKHMKATNKAIATGQLAVLDALVNHPNRDAILEILEEPLIGDRVDAMSDDQWQKEYLDSHYHTTQDPTDRMGSTIEALADHMIYKVKDLACWRMANDEGFKRMTLDGQGYVKHCQRTAKERRYHGIREHVFYAKTYKYLPLPGEAKKVEKRRESISDESINGLFAHFNAVNK